MPRLLQSSRTTPEACNLAVDKMTAACGNKTTPSLKTINNVPQCAQAMDSTYWQCCTAYHPGDPNRHPLCDSKTWTHMSTYWTSAPGLRVAVPFLGTQIVSDTNEVHLDRTGVALQRSMLPPSEGTEQIPTYSGIGFTPTGADTPYRCFAVDKEGIVRKSTDVPAEKLFCCPYPDNAIPQDDLMEDLRYETAQCPHEEAPRVFSWNADDQVYNEESQQYR